MDPPQTFAGHETLRAYETMSKHGEFATGYAKLLGDMVYGEKPELEAAFGMVQHFVEQIRKAWNFWDSPALDKEESV